MTQAATTANADTLERVSARLLLACAGLSLAAAVLYGLTAGEFVTRFEQACLHRFCDVDGYLFHNLHDSWRYTHPNYGAYADRVGTMPMLLAETLARAGVGFSWSVNVVVLMMRTTFGMGIALLLIAATGRHRLTTACFGVLLACTLPANAHIYGHLFHLALTGIFSTSLFLIACSLVILGRPRLAVAFWLLQGWSHPTTFVCWAPVFVGLLVYHVGFRLRVGLAAKVYLGAMVVLPPLAAGLAGVAERAGLLPFVGSNDYWALVRVKACHSVFFFRDGYALPLQYASQTAALLILGLGYRRSDNEATSPLRQLNLLAGFGGLGIGLMYLLTVETHFSVLANMLLPLRFECVMYPLIVANLVRAVYRSASASPASDRRLQAGRLALGCAYAGVLLFPAFAGLTWAWLWALGERAFASVGIHYRQRMIPAVAAFAGMLLVAVYIVFGPTTHAVASNIRPAVTALCVGLAIAGAGAVGCKLSWRPKSRLVAVSACIALAAIAPRTWRTNPGIALAEIRALAGGATSTPEREALGWLNNQLPPGTPVLVANTLFLHRLTHLRTSINKDVIDFFLYAPDRSAPTIEEMRGTYGRDLRAMAQRRETLRIEGDDWRKLRHEVLATGRAGERAYRYIVEPASFEPAEDHKPIFANAALRVYRTAAPTAQAMR